MCPDGLDGVGFALAQGEKDPVEGVKLFLLDALKYTGEIDRMSIHLMYAMLNEENQEKVNRLIEQLITEQS